MSDRRLRNVIAVLWLATAYGLLTLGTGISQAAQENSEVQKGRVYDAKHKNKLMFLFDRRVEGPPDKHHVVVRFLSPEGKELVHEEVDYEGERFHNYTIDKLQTGEHGEVSVQKGKIQFRYRDRDRKEKQNTETWDNSVIVIDELPWFIQQNWKSLKAKKSVPFRFVVPDRAQTVAFELSVRGTGRCKSGPAVLMKMKVRSALMGLFAPDVLLTVSEQEPHSICEYTGPTPPYNAELKEVEGRTVFE